MFKNPLHWIQNCLSNIEGFDLEVYSRALELSEFLRFPSRQIEQQPASGWLLTTPVTVGVINATTTTMTITMHPVIASANRMVLLTTGALPSAGAPLLTMATPSAYARLAYLHMPVMRHEPDWLLPCPICKAVGHQFHADSVRVYPETYVGQDGCSRRPRRRSRIGRRGWRNSCCWHRWATCVQRALWTRWSERLCHHQRALWACHSGWPARWSCHTWTIVRTSATGTIGHPVFDGCYEYACRSNQAGAIGHCEHAVWDGWSTGAGTAGAAKYARMAVVANHIGTAGAARYVDAAGNGLFITCGYGHGPAPCTKLELLDSFVGLDTTDSNVDRTAA